MCSVIFACCLEMTTFLASRELVPSWLDGSLPNIRASRQPKVTLHGARTSRQPAPAFYRFFALTTLSCTKLTSSSFQQSSSQPACKRTEKRVRFERQQRESSLTLKYSKSASHNSPLATHLATHPNTPSPQTSFSKYGSHVHSPRTVQQLQRQRQRHQ